MSWFEYISYINIEMVTLIIPRVNTIYTQQINTKKSTYFF